MVVWYVVRDGEFVSVLVRDEPDTFGMRQEALQYPDCRVWTHIHLGWCHMWATEAGSSIWWPASPPECVLLAQMLRE